LSVTPTSRGPRDAALSFIRRSRSTPSLANESFCFFLQKEVLF
jgi:hypothetical protein